MNAGPEFDGVETFPALHAPDGTLWTPPRTLLCAVGDPGCMSQPLVWRDGVGYGLTHPSTVVCIDCGEWVCANCSVDDELCNICWDGREFIAARSGDLIPLPARHTKSTSKRERRRRKKGRSGGRIVASATQPPLPALDPLRFVPGAPEPSAAPRRRA